MVKRWLNVENLLWVSLALALAGSLKHLANVFSLVDGDTLLGWLQAVAIDIGLFALAYTIKIRRVANRDTKPLWFGVILFSAISIYGNLAYGLLAIEKVIPYWIVVSKPYVLAASLPVLVIFLSELLSDNYHYHVGNTQPVSMVLTTDNSVNDMTLELLPSDIPSTNSIAPVTNSNHTDAVPSDNQVTIRRQRIADIFDASKGRVTQADIAKQLGVSVSTVRNDMKVLNGTH